MDGRTTCVVGRVDQQTEENINNQCFFTGIYFLSRTLSSNPFSKQDESVYWGRLLKKHAYSAWTFGAIEIIEGQK